MVSPDCLQKFFAVFASLTIVLIFYSTSFALVRNYDNNPVLAKALEYDFELNGGDPNKADRSKAEQYYLEYLKDVNESFQKARIYTQLGALYAVAVNRKIGEEPDYEKAKYYLKKVLDLEPNRIDRETIRARTLLLSMNTVRTERIKANMDVYDWLVPINENKIKELWLPLTPNEKGPSENQIGIILNNTNASKSMLETNIISGIKAIDEQGRTNFLDEITKRFPNTNLEKLALDFIEKQKDSLNVPPPIISSNKLTESNLKKALLEPNLIPNTLLNESDKSLFSKPIFYLSIGGVCLIAIGLIAIQKNRKTKQSS
jgi:hypothetical protein